MTHAGLRLSQRYRIRCGRSSWLLGRVIVEFTPSRTLSTVALEDYVFVHVRPSLWNILLTSLPIRSLICRWITSLPTSLSLSLSLSLSRISGLYLYRYRRLPTLFSPKKTLTRTKSVTGVKSAVRRLLVLPPPTLLSGSCERTPDVVRR